MKISGLLIFLASLGAFSSAQADVFVSGVGHVNSYRFEDKACHKGLKLAAALCPPDTHTIEIISEKVEHYAIWGGLPPYFAKAKCTVTVLCMTESQ